MASKDPDARRKVNALHYDKQMLDPKARARMAAQQKRWRDANPELRRAQHLNYYRRNAARICFEDKLWRMLLKIRKAEIERGRVPYDG